MGGNTQSNPAVRESLSALIRNFLDNKQAEAIVGQLTEIVLNTEKDFLTRDSELKACFRNHPEIADLEDVAFDLLLVQFLSSEEHPADFFDSQEWEQIEDKTLDQGSEMITLFHYLSEAGEAGAEVSLRDFLDEFLSLGDDGLQEDFQVYESLIKHDNLTEASLDSIREVQKTVKADTGLKPYFVPLVLFFQYAENLLDEEELDNLNAFENAILQTLIAYYTELNNSSHG